MAIVLSRYSGNAWILCISYLFCVKPVLIVASAELTISCGTAVLSFDSGDSFSGGSTFRTFAMSHTASEIVVYAFWCLYLWQRLLPK